MIREYYEKLSAYLSDNLSEIDKFLEWHKLPILTYEELDNLTRSIFIKEIESVITTFKKEIPVPDGYTGEFHEIFNKEMILILTIHPRK